MNAADAASMLSKTLIYRPLDALHLKRGQARSAAIPPVALGARRIEASLLAA